VLPKQRPVRRRFAILGCSVLALVAPASAVASELIDRDATGVRLAVNRSGQALLTYRAGGKPRRVLAWGAVNAIAPTTSRRQIAFRLDYSGGWGTFRRDAWRGFRNACRPYDGPALAWVVTACKAPDASYWAVQSWQRMLPNYGLEATPKQAVWELRLSHWTGPPAVRHGFRATPGGNPLETFGRNLYLDTMDSAYGGGWRRENSFLTHRGSGAFCYGFYAHGSRPAGDGTRYRATIIGPGVTPDVFWQSPAPGPYDRTQDLVANDEQRELFASSPLCRPN
jgi:hypothetical protein